jgi:hypothetical protein
MDTFFDFIKQIILLLIAYDLNKNPRKYLHIKNSFVFLIKTLQHAPSAILSKEKKEELREYGQLHSKEKQTVGKWIDYYFWNISRPGMVYFLPFALMYLVWTDPKLESINVPYTYLILCVTGFLLGLLFDWAKYNQNDNVKYNR